MCGVFTVEAVTYFQRVYTGIKDAGCDTVALRCTEIPVIMSDTNSLLPIARLDPTARSRGPAAQ